MKYRYLILFIVCSIIAKAQDVSVAYIRANGQRTNIPDSALFIRTIAKSTSATEAYTFTERYRNGTLRRTGTTLRNDLIVPDGLCTTYLNGKKFQEISSQKGRTDSITEFFPNGKIYQVTEYVYDTHQLTPTNKAQEILIIACYDSTGKVLAKNGNGHYIAYRPLGNQTFNENGSFSYNKAPGFDVVYDEGELRDGRKEGNWSGTSEEKNKIKYIEKYKSGKLVSGQSTDADGRTYKYTERDEVPKFAGGNAALYRFLSNTLNYPVTARDHGIKGKVIIVLTIAADGKVEDIKVGSSPSDDLSAEAVRVMMLSPKWEPGKRFGQPTKMTLALAIPFPYAKI